MSVTPRPPMSARRPQALADLNLNTILASEHSNSSDEELKPNDEQDEEAGSVLGVSIGKEQSRLTSPRTPAVEKTSALNKSGGYFESIAEEQYDGANDGQKGTLGHDLTADVASDDRPPSPWRVEQRRMNESRSILRDGFFFGRKRSSSGPDRKGSIFANMPNVSKSFASTSSRTSLNNFRSRGSPVRPSTQSVAKEAVESRSPSPDRVTDIHSTTDPTSRPQLEPLRTRPSQLRRSASESSLGPIRTLSHVSSLGDDSQWENVHEMVNSRFKAIKDSFQDADIRLPSMPNFSVTSFTPAFMRERSDSASKKDVIDPVTRQPYHSSRAAVADIAGDKALQHPHLHYATNQLEGDLVILGGYRGSILRSAEPPNRQVWVPVKVGLNLRKVDLEVGIEEGADEKATEKIIPDGMLTHIGPVDISRRLFKRLRSCERARNGTLRVHDYGYDWRLHPHHLSKQLIRFLEGLPCNKPRVPKEKRGALVVAHSLGGLITRHAVNQRPELFRGVVYAGVPKTCVNILGPLRNGDDVLLSSRVLTAQVNFTIRTSFALLPLDGRCFIDKETNEEYRVDFFDSQQWIDFRLSPCVARPLPPLVEPKQAGGIAGYMNSLTNALPSFSMPGRKSSASKAQNVADPSKATMAAGMVAEPDSLQHGSHGSEQAVAEGNIDTSKDGAQGREPQEDQNTSVKTAVTMPRQDAIDYLTRTLATVKKFKEELAFNKSHAKSNAYPPVSVIYGKSVPTVYGARVQGRDGIKRADAYEDLAFGSGDGVVLAKASMLPEGYTAARGGIVKTERGHVTMLGDLEAVAKCLNAVMAARKRGVGLGPIDSGRRHA